MSDFTARQLFVTPDQRHARTVELLREEHRRAVLCVCAQSGGSTEDVRELLDALGLDPREGLRERPEDLVTIAPIGAVRPSGTWNDPGEKRRGKK